MRLDDDDDDDRPYWRARGRQCRSHCGRAPDYYYRLVASEHSAHALHEHLLRLVFRLLADDMRAIVRVRGTCSHFLRIVDNDRQLWAMLCVQAPRRRRDYCAAERFLRRAAESGNASACFALALMYHYGYACACHAAMAPVPSSSSSSSLSVAAVASAFCRVNIGSGR